MYILVIIGGSIFVILGLAHGASTLQSSLDGGPMTPTDPHVREAMAIRGGLGLAPRIDRSLFEAWTGFNLSHSVGALAIGLVIIIPAARDIDGAVHDIAWLAAALVAPLVYFVLSKRYWFRDPTRFITIAAAAIYVGVAVQLIR